MNDQLRQLPSIHVLLETPCLKQAADEYGHSAVVQTARRMLDHLRRQMLNESKDQLPGADALAERIAQGVRQAETFALREVINATGILLHTGLGRAPLAKSAIEAIDRLAGGYCNVELDLPTGRRAKRTDAAARLLCELTGSEAAHLVNNTAAAMGLALTTLAVGREVIVSHGELIEIGGGFRLPEVIESFGAVLRPVGTTNRTRISDYARAVGERTGALLVAHSSNFRVSGFTEKPELSELAQLARRHDLPLIHDIGSGALLDFARFGGSREPIAQQSIRDGADLVLFSGDKLIGGPQCGVILGRHEYVDRLARHPMTRALRVGKLTLAALLETLRLYRDPDKAIAEIPLLRFLNQDAAVVRQRAEAVLREIASTAAGAELAEDVAYVGGGTLPEQGIESWSVAIPAGEGGNIERLARRLRLGDPSVVGRVHQDRVVLNVHTVEDHRLPSLCHAIVEASSSD